MDQQQSQDFPAKLTDWANEPTLLSLKQDLEQSKTAHDMQVAKIQEWNDLLKVRGKHRPPKVKGRSSVQPKLIRRQAEWRYSALTEPFLSSDKLYKVKPTTFEDDKASKQNELMLNYQFRTKLNRVKFIDDYVRSTVDEGTSIIQVGWIRRTVKLKKLVPEYTHFEIQDEEQLQQFQQALELSQQDHRTYLEQTPPEIQAAISLYEQNGQANYAQQTGQKEVEYEKVIENRPTAEIRDPRNICIDPSCLGDIEKAMFVIVSFETCKSDLLKEGKRYKNLDKINWEGATPIVEPDHATSTPETFNFRDAARKKVVAYEYWGFWDIKGDGNLVPFVASWIGNTMIRMELNPFPDEKLPFIVVPYLPVKRELYGEPDAELLEDNQKISGAVMRGMIDLLGRSANGQQGFAKGMLDPLNKRRFENGQDYEFNPGVSPLNGYLEHKYPELPQSGLQMLNIQNQEAEALTGVKSFAGGMSGQAFGDVAAGIRGVLDAASKREMAILRRLAKGIADLGQKIIAMNAVFLSKEEVIRVTNEPYIDVASVSATDKMMGHNGGPPMEDSFVTIRRDDLKGSFDLEVDISTAEIDDSQAKDLAFLLQTIGNTLDPSFTIMILAEIARLKKMPALEKKLLTWKQPVDPIAEQLKQLEVQKAQKEIEVLDSEINLNNAKAKAAGSQADKTDLDFVDQQSGVAHARDMEKQQAQGEANQDLVVTKALATPRKEGEKKPDVEAAIGYNQLTKGSNQTNSEFSPPIVDNSQHSAELAPAVQTPAQFDPALTPA